MAVLIFMLEKQKKRPKIHHGWFVWSLCQVTEIMAATSSLRTMSLYSPLSLTHSMDNKGCSFQSLYPIIATQSAMLWLLGLNRPPT